MLALAPSLHDVSSESVPEADMRLWAASLILPSSFTRAQRETLGLQELGSIESELRIGHGHDILEKVRKALSIRSFLSKRARMRTNYRTHTRSQEEIHRSQIIVRQWAEIYRKNFKALVKLEISGPILRGLQELKDGDLTMLSAWMDNEQYWDPSSSLPWIWKVSPLMEDHSDNQPDTDKVTELVASWNYEGANLSDFLLLSSCNIYIVRATHRLRFLPFWL